MSFDLNLNFLGVSVVDWQAAYHFYTQIIGIQTARLNPDFGDWALLGGGWDAYYAGNKSMIFELFDGAKPPQGDMPVQGFRPAIHVDDLDATVAMLRDSGVHFTTPIETRPYGQRITFMATEGVLWSLAHIPNTPSGTIEIPFIGHILLKAQDVASQRAFYRDVLGLCVVDEGADYVLLQRTSGEPLLIIEAGGQRTIPDPNWSDPVRAQPVFISFMTADIDAAHARFTDSNCNILRPVTRHDDWGGTDMLITDVDGHAIQVVQYG